VSLANNAEAIVRSKQAVFYIASVLSSFANGVIGPLFIVYLLSIHLTAAQIGMLLVAERISIIIFEFPTGVFADRYGRKKSLLISFSVIALLLIGWFFVRNFYIFLFLAIVWGIAYTFQSGAKEALIIDSLNLENHDEARNKIFSRLAIYGNAGFLFGGLIATLLAFIRIDLIWPAAGFLNFLLFGLYFLFTTETRQIDRGSRKIRIQIREMFVSAMDSIRSIFSRRIISYFLVVTMIFGFATAIYGLAYPIFFKDILNVPNYYFGFLGALSAFVGILGALLGEKLTKQKGYYFAMSCFPIAIFISYFILGVSSIFWLCVIFFAFIELIINGWFPIYQSFFNKFVPSKIRSSILSANSTASLLSIAAGEALAGFLLMVIHPGNLIAWSGLLFIFIPFILVFIKRSEVEGS